MAAPGAQEACERVVANTKLMAAADVASCEEMVRRSQAILDLAAYLPDEQLRSILTEAGSREKDIAERCVSSQNARVLLEDLAVAPIMNRYTTRLSELGITSRYEARNS